MKSEGASGARLVKWVKNIVGLCWDHVVLLVSYPSGEILLKVRPYLLDLMLHGPDRLYSCMTQNNNENWITCAKMEAEPASIL